MRQEIGRRQRREQKPDIIVEMWSEKMSIGLSGCGRSETKGDGHDFGFAEEESACRLS